jgi:hypothetical protein
MSATTTKQRPRRLSATNSEDVDFSESTSSTSNLTPQRTSLQQQDQALIENNLQHWIEKKLSFKFSDR